MCTGSNQGLLGPKSDALTTAPLRHLVVVVLGFYNQPTAKVIRSRDLGLKPYPKDWPFRPDIQYPFVKKMTISVFKGVNDIISE